MNQPYELKRSEEFDESVKIGDEIIPVTLDPTNSAADFQRLYNKLVNAQCEIKRGPLPPERLDELNKECGDYIMDLMALIFGDDGAKKIINFYKGNYTKLIFAIIPFIRDRLKPMLDKYTSEIKKSYRKAIRRW